ncbi:MAG TPA: SAM-dependent methyltransferase [Alphaproteobacteria bacterium]|nr:SAM-dependent methyltransferase [Alphaproteobacteria bacterium]
MTLALHKNSREILPLRETEVADSGRKKFICPEESSRYSGSLEQLVFNKLRDIPINATVIEFGSGTGSPVISAILNSGFWGTVHGYEISPEAAETANALIWENQLSRQYIIHNESFFEAKAIPQADYLIANPPYIPCDDRNSLLLSGLCGGPEGNDVSKKLLSAGYKNVFLEVSSYSNPVAVVEHARSLGYKIIDFQTTQMPFGMYSRQPHVWQRIQELKSAGKAFFSANCYMVGSALFTRDLTREADLSAEFIAGLTALR